MYIAIFINIIDHTILLVDTAAPSVHVFEPLRLSYSLFCPIAIYILYQVINLSCNLSVILYPIHQISKGYILKISPHRSTALIPRR